MKYLKVFTDFTIDIESLSFEERGRLFTAMLEYAGNGSAPPLPGNERYVWGTAKKQIDAQLKSYESKCESVDRARGHRNQKKNSEINMKSREEQEQEQEQEQNKRKKRESSAFRAPSVDEVRAYCSERGNDVDAEHFVAYYQSNGWKVGRNPMKDWKAAVRSWEKRDLERGEPKTTNQFLQLLMEEGGHL